MPCSNMSRRVASSGVVSATTARELVASAMVGLPVMDWGTRERALAPGNLGQPCLNVKAVKVLQPHAWSSGVRDPKLESESPTEACVVVVVV